ncbi:hypothetical protein POM88_043720 [Heracleum sosnowskyi]|uniref:Uncharacterized protein n=1 Tax=Heracleum sosnowskyi TaxID=360622 RepID=A0AAD8H458_9APIA|nr:hypothetical protein POM88_043720 [Heracleum sosnowskyi]
MNLLKAASLEGSSDNYFSHAFLMLVPPPGKGSLYIRPLLMGSGSVLSLAPAPEFTFLIYVSPVGNYFKDGLSPIDLMVEIETHRATPGGTGCVKTIGNYAAVLKAQSSAKAKGYSDVLKKPRQHFNDETMSRLLTRDCRSPVEKHADIGEGRFGLERIAAVGAAFEGKEGAITDGAAEPIKKKEQ